MARDFPHERLEAYKLALSTARWVLKLKFPRGLSHLRDQAVRCSTSIPLNIAEGNALMGDARRNHLRIAHGSAAELCALLDLIDFPDTEEQQHNLRRVGAMLYVLARR